MGLSLERIETLDDNKVSPRSTSLEKDLATTEIVIDDPLFSPPSRVPPLSSASPARIKRARGELRGARTLERAAWKIVSTAFFFHRRAFSSSSATSRAASLRFFLPFPLLLLSSSAVRGPATPCVLMLAPRFMGCRPRIPRAEEGAAQSEGRKKEKEESWMRSRERERVVPARTKIECEKRRTTTAARGGGGGGERPFERWCSFRSPESLLIISEKERDGFAISTLATRHFLRDYRVSDYRSYYTSRHPLNNNYLDTHSTAIINLRRGREIPQSGRKRQRDV